MYDFIYITVNGGAHPALRHPVVAAGLGLYNDVNIYQHSYEYVYPGRVTPGGTSRHRYYMHMYPDKFRY